MADNETPDNPARRGFFRKVKKAAGYAVATAGLGSVTGGHIAAATHEGMQEQLDEAASEASSPQRADRLRTKALEAADRANNAKLSGYLPGAAALYVGVHIASKADAEIAAERQKTGPRLRPLTPDRRQAIKDMLNAGAALTGMGAGLGVVLNASAANSEGHARVLYGEQVAQAEADQKYGIIFTKGREASGYRAQGEAMKAFGTGMGAIFTSIGLTTIGLTNRRQAKEENGKSR